MTRKEKIFVQNSNGESKEREILRLLPSSLVEKVEKVEAGQVSLSRNSLISNRKISVNRIESPVKRKITDFLEKLPEDRISKQKIARKTENISALKENNLTRFGDNPSKGGSAD